MQTLLPEPIPKTQERREEFADAKGKMLCEHRLLVEMQTGESTPAGPQAGMKNEACVREKAGGREHEVR